VVLFLLPLVFFGCGEEGVQTDIEKTTTVSFDILKDQVNATADGAYQLKQTIDFAAEDFQQYINDTRSFRIEKLQFEIKGVDETLPISLINDLAIALNVDNTTYQFLQADNVRLENTARVLLYEVNNPINILNEEQIATLERIADYVLNQRPMDFNFDAIFAGRLYSNFTITFYFDMVAQVDLD